MASANLLLLSLPDTTVRETFTVLLDDGRTVERLATDLAPIAAGTVLPTIADGSGL